jgi:hypothetical protein
MSAEIYLAAGDRWIDLRARCALDIADVGEAFRPQQLLGDKLRRVAERRSFHKAHRGGFERSLCRQRFRHPLKTRVADQ